MLENTSTTEKLGQGTTQMINPNPTQEVKGIGVNTGVSNTPVFNTPKVNKNEGYHFGTTVRLGSRKIQLKIVPKFSMLPKDPGAQSIRDEVVKRVASQWKRGTRDIIRGLTPEEEEVYLPTFIGVKPSSDTWDDAAREFWANFSIDVPSTEDGIDFEAGFHKVKRKNEEIIEPINLVGYMQYNFCLLNSSVAAEDEDNFITYTFQMIDKAKNQSENEKQYEVRKDLEVEYLKLVRSTNEDERAKIDWILEIYGGEYNQGINIFGLTTIQKEMELEKFKNKQVLLFKEILSDPKLELKALIRKAVTRSEITIEGNTYFHRNKALGDLSATLGYFSDPNHQTERLMLVEKLKA